MQSPLDRPPPVDLHVEFDLVGPRPENKDVHSRFLQQPTLARSAPSETSGGMSPRTIAALGVVVGALWLGACQSDDAYAPKPLDQAIRHPNPGVRTAAVQRVIQSGDTSEVPELIEMLDDEDPTVRMLASSSLRRITGRDTGYLPFAAPAIRRAQRDEWRVWWNARQQTGAVAPQGAPALPEPAPLDTERRFEVTPR